MRNLMLKNNRLNTVVKNNNKGLVKQTKANLENRINKWNQREDFISRNNLYVPSNGNNSSNDLTDPDIIKVIAYNAAYDYFNPKEKSFRESNVYRRILNGLKVFGSVTGTGVTAVTGFACVSSEPAIIEEAPQEQTEEVVIETKPIEKQEDVEEKKSKLELELEKVFDGSLRSKIKNELQNSYFTNDTEKVNYISEVINMNQEGMMINYLFDNDYFNSVYNPGEKISWVKAFNERGFDEFVADALLVELAKAKDPRDADGDLYDNLFETDGKDKNGVPYPFVDKDTGEKITYVDENGNVKEDKASNPLDKKDTPKHMAKFDMILVNGAVEAIDGGLVNEINKELEKYYNYIKGNSHLDDLLIVTSKDLGIEIKKGTYINWEISFSELKNKINETLINNEKTLPGANHILFLFDVPGPKKDYQKSAYFCYSEPSELQIKNFLKELYPNYDGEHIFQFIACQSGNLSLLQDSGFTIMHAADSGIFVYDAPPQKFTDELKLNYFIDLGEAHNKSVSFEDYAKEYATDQYNTIDGLQYVVKKLESGEDVFYDKYGPFQFAKSNGNYVRWPEGNIKRNHLAYPKVEESKGDYIFKNGEYIKKENGDYIKIELKEYEKAPIVVNFLTDLFK